MHYAAQDILIELVASTTTALLVAQRCARAPGRGAAEGRGLVVACTVADKRARTLLSGLLSRPLDGDGRHRARAVGCLAALAVVAVKLRGSPPLTGDRAVVVQVALRALEWYCAFAEHRSRAAMTDHDQSAWARAAHYGDYLYSILVRRFDHA